MQSFWKSDTGKNSTWDAWQRWRRLTKVRTLPRVVLQPGQAESTDAATSLSGFRQHLSEIIFLGCDDRGEEDTELTLNDVLGDLSRRCSTSMSESLLSPCERQTADAVVRSFYEQQRQLSRKTAFFVTKQREHLEEHMQAIERSLLRQKSNFEYMTAQMRPGCVAHEGRT